MLLGYGDLHGCNIGVMKVRDREEDPHYVLAKVDMSASFYNLKYVHYMDYIYKFKHMINPRVTPYRAKFNINYDTLKTEINTACDLFNNPEYVESLIHRALFYKEPLLKTKEELDLVQELAQQIIKQAELLKEFANSEVFTHLEEYIESGYLSYIAWSVDNNKKIEGQDPIVYAMENRLPIEGKNPLIWAIENEKKIEGIEPFNWVNQNKDKPFLCEWLRKHSIISLDHFQKSNDLVEEIKEPESATTEEHSIIERLVKAVEGNLKRNDAKAQLSTSESITYQSEAQQIVQLSNQDIGITASSDNYKRINTHIGSESAKSSQTEERKLYAALGAFVGFFSGIFIACLVEAFIITPLLFPHLILIVALCAAVGGIIGYVGAKICEDEPNKKVELRFNNTVVNQHNTFREAGVSSTA